MKIKVWEVDTLDDDGTYRTFRFVEESKDFARDHVHALNWDPDFATVVSEPRMVGWVDENFGGDLDDLEGSA
jgi:hypothetical protein